MAHLFSRPFSRSSSTLPSWLLPGFAFPYVTGDNQWEPVADFYRLDALPVTSSQRSQSTEGK